MSKYKIVMLGGGSPFTLSMINIFIENKEVLGGSEIWLMDIDQSRLPVLTKTSEILSKKNGADMKFIWTTDPKKALIDADFVLPGYRIGGIKHMNMDIEIPTKYGICGDETTGPGGTFMAQYTIPATIEYCRMIEELCPNAWVISYVNPANLVADAVRRLTKVKFISICDCFAGFSMNFLPKLFKKPPYDRRYCINEDIRPRAIGVNHLTWLVDLELNGQDGLPHIKRLIDKYSGKTLHDRPLQLMADLYNIFGYLNICPYHVRPYWDYDSFIKERSIKPFHEASVLGWSDTRWKFVQEMAEGKEFTHWPLDYCFEPHHSRHAVGILVSLASDDGREWGGMNFPNRGSISNLPYDAIIEGHCIVDSHGLTRIALGELPKPFVALTLQVINWQELSVDAAISGDKDILYKALLSSPYIHDLKSAKLIMDELLQAHAEILPQYNGKKIL